MVVTRAAIARQEKAPSAVEFGISSTLCLFFWQD